MQTPHCWG
ncbi:hypothetical protein YPPY94_1090, partial [Yersinia pestis PY-94]